MAVNKVEINGEVKLDLTQDTVTPATLAKGKTAHNAAGEQIIGTMDTGGSSAPGAPGDITFYDYDGTIVTSWTLSELTTKTALPDYPSHNGLICQGWNWSLAGLKSGNRKMNVGADYITTDGKTRIYIKLLEGRTSPVLGCAPNGTVTVDWGDDTVPDTLTGTSTSTILFTQPHNYAAPGEYVISLSVSSEGSVAFKGNNGSDATGLLNYAGTADNRNVAYKSAIQKIEIGERVSIGSFAFSYCMNMQTITRPTGSLPGNYAFYYCYSLKSATVNASRSYLFQGCRSLKTIQWAENAYVDTRSNNMLMYCNSLETLYLPGGSIKIMGGFANATNALREVETATATELVDLETSCFASCLSLTRFKCGAGLTSIAASAFSGCISCKLYDFSQSTEVPTLGNTNAFNNIPADCEIRVPAALADKWKAATNWSTYADHIVGV